MPQAEFTSYKATNCILVGEDDGVGKSQIRLYIEAENRKRLV